MPARPVNFILFNPDEMRAESLGCYGHPAARTPHLDRLAAEGVRFEQCHAQHTVCSPSRCSFMTGWYPHVRGHRTLWHLLRPEEPNLLKYLKQAGYDVRWWGKNDLLAPDSFAGSVTSAGRPDQGPFAPAKLGPPPRPICSAAPGSPEHYSFLRSPNETGAPEEHPDFRCVRAAIEYLRAGPEKPFVLYLPIGFPHCPYWAPRPWHDLIDPDTLPPLRPMEGAGRPDFHQLIRRYRGLDRLDEAIFRKINAVYLGMIAFVDHMLGRLLDALEASGHAGDTAVFVFSDHGDWAGDYGLVEKWPSGLDDCLTRVPLILRVPGNTPGHAAPEVVELFDILPTILELAGIPSRHTHFARSLLPQLSGAPGDPERAAFAEGGYDLQEPHCFEGYPPRGEKIMHPGHVYYPKLAQQQEVPESVCRSVMVRTRSHKLVRRSSGAHELYDLSRDPRETTNVYARPEYEHARGALENRLLEWYLRTSDVTPEDENPRGFPAPQPVFPDPGRP